MNIFSKLTATLILVLSLSAPAVASGYKCKSGPVSEWMSQDSILKSLVTKGYEIRKIEVEDGCYEVYVLKDGKRFEIFVNPTTGAIEKIKEK